MQILKTTLYIMSGIVLVAGLFISISLLSGADNMAANFLLPLQFMGGGAILNLAAPMLTGFLLNLGIVTFVLTFIISALLYSVGRLIGYIALLEARLSRLEARI